MKKFGTYACARENNKHPLSWGGGGGGGGGDEKDKRKRFKM